jgi:hypothetical protein
MPNQKVPKGTIEIKKTLADLKLGKTAIILTTEDKHRLKHIVDNIDKIPEDFDCEIILVTKESLMEEGIMDIFFRTKRMELVNVSEHVGKIAMQNIGRQLVHIDCKYLLFLDDFSEVNKDWLENRVKGFEYNPIIGIIGRGMPKVTDELKQLLFDKVQGLIRLSEEDFAERCCNKEGGFRNVSNQSLATPVKVFDRIGGFDIYETEPSLIYQLRAQALGFALIPQPN